MCRGASLHGHNADGLLGKERQHLPAFCASVVLHGSVVLGLQEVLEDAAVGLPNQAQTLADALGGYSVRLYDVAPARLPLAQGAGQPLSGRFRLGVIPTVAPFLLPAKLPGVKAEWPALRLFIREDLTPRLITGLKAGQLDAAVIALPYSAPGIDHARIGDDEILERTVYAMVNEGAKILEEGIALRASDIDTVYINGYGWPVYRGGPMFYADTVGPATVVEKLTASGATIAPSGAVLADFQAAEHLVILSAGTGHGKVDDLIRRAGIELDWQGTGVDEKGVDRKTGKTLVAVDPRYFRPTEVEQLLGNPAKAMRDLGWNPQQTSFEQLVQKMVDHDLKLVAHANR